MQLDPEAISASYSLSFSSPGGLVGLAARAARVRWPAELSNSVSDRDCLLEVAFLCTLLLQFDPGGLAGLAARAARVLKMNKDLLARHA